MFLGHPISRPTQIALKISQPNVVVSPCVSRSDTVGANVPRAVQVLTLPVRAAGKAQLHRWSCRGDSGGAPTNSQMVGHLKDLKLSGLFLKTADLISALVKSANI